ncbi:tRNA adenosine(34) deaminase TadA [Legionella sp. MW5194]|uniref:tRNA adenosine(34) deaminase TadA n=1 Tax=Legionella sp. MW5194 TaxID=2662448 RepID=UPI00193CB2DA|nr:tRNA adenosine(34) deaminase TadA [Legionella sp. MW5194]
MNDSGWMQKAYELALAAKQAGEVPVGAVLVDSNNQLLAAAGNRVITHSDPCAHAEILVLREAAQKQANFRLLDTTLYVTLEPCAMCAGAMVHARIKRLVFAARDVKAGAAGSVYNLLKGYPLNHPVQIDEGFLEVECSALLKEFFMTRRS